MQHQSRETFKNEHPPPPLECAIVAESSVAWYSFVIMADIDFKEAERGKKRASHAEKQPERQPQELDEGR